ncbi:helix-turn-helix domain-containing protein [Burkholderia multivorans]|uniref:helix-turn-helix domain-containing protein n=1 Tax=Burkholderia multivorans TaxID=87883 RepID=UPI001C23C46D|nr:helix-turn-helix transcriptional regulator [Burkholderia multivorans]MBU9413523.1 helix-turn-helix domain-containing protein [Burkholderia multivorans]
MLDTRKILQENLKALLATRPEISRLNLSREMKVSDGTLGSIQYGTGNPTVEILETIAQFFGLETWQLFSPNFGHATTDPGTKPRGRQSARWPFPGINPADFDVLTYEDREEIEHYVTYKIKRRKVNSTRRKKS